MGCPALGVWVAFLKQPIFKLLLICDFLKKKIIWGASPSSAGCVKIICVIVFSEFI
jgi:hypothetical protein